MTRLWSAREHFVDRQEHLLLFQVRPKMAQFLDGTRHLHTPRGHHALPVCGRTGFLLPVNQFDLLSTVDTLRNGAVRWAMGRAGRSAVLGRTWPAVCDELLGHYRQVSGSPAQVA